MGKEVAVLVVCLDSRDGIHGSATDSFDSSQLNPWEHRYFLSGNAAGDGAGRREVSVVLAQRTYDCDQDVGWLRE